MLLEQVIKVLLGFMPVKLPLLNWPRPPPPPSASLAMMGSGFRDAAYGATEWEDPEAMPPERSTGAARARRSGSGSGSGTHLDAIVVELRLDKTLLGGDAEQAVQREGRKDKGVLMARDRRPEARDRRPGGGDAEYFGIGMPT